MQAATLYAASFVVGAGMEMFMIKTGFYDVATRKEAERRAMAQWEREEAGRVQEQRALERARREAEREKQDLQHYRKRLVEELTTLRCKEQAEGVKLNDEKVRPNTSGCHHVAVPTLRPVAHRVAMHCRYSILTHVFAGPC
jgi:hypothetical protein